MRFCSQCGTELVERIPEGEDRLRSVCPACHFVHYVNPKLVVGCLVEEQGQILLCKRAIEPQRGLWTLPAGFLEIDEGTAEGAVRETWEEARAEVEVTGLHAHLDIPHIGQAYVLFHARFRRPGYGAGPESLEVEMVPLEAIPWEEIAFPVIRLSLELYVEDRRRAQPHVHHGIVRKNAALATPYMHTSYALDAHLALPLRS